MLDTGGMASSVVWTHPPGLVGGDGSYTILSNPRKTDVSPPGHGLVSRETAWHHQQVSIEEGVCVLGGGRRRR